MVTPFARALAQGASSADDARTGNNQSCSRKYFSPVGPPNSVLRPQFGASMASQFSFSSARPSPSTFAPRAAKRSHNHTRSWPSHDQQSRVASRLNGFRHLLRKTFNQNDSLPSISHVLTRTAHTPRTSKIARLHRSLTKQLEMVLMGRHAEDAFCRAA